LANYLSTIRNVSNAIKVGQDFDVSGKALDRAGRNAGYAALTALASGQNPLNAAAGSLSSIPGVPTALRAVNSLTGGALGLGGLSGSKPKALHTEYASGNANWQKPYGAGTDIVFYLMRADGGGAGSGEDAAAQAGFGDSAGLSGLNEGLAKAAAGVQTGPGLPNNLQSAVNQVAAGTKMAGTDFLNAVKPGLAGPLTGLTEGLEVGLEAVTQTAAITASGTDLVKSAVGAVNNGFSDFSPRSLGASEHFFSQTLDNTFNPGLALGGAARSASEILDSANKVPVSEFSAQLAKATGGVTSTSDFVEGLNYGRFGYSTAKNNSSAERMGPTGKTQRKRA